MALINYLECEFFESPVGLPEVLAGLGVAALLGVELSLELTDAGLQLGNDALTSLEGGGLSLVKASLWGKRHGEKKKRRRRGKRKNEK